MQVDREQSRRRPLAAPSRDEAGRDGLYPAAPAGGAGRARFIERRIALARWALAWEQVWPRLAPAAGIAALFLIISLFDLWRLLGGYGHAAALALFALAFGAALIWAIVTVRWPGRAEARRRLEQANALRHRPLTALEDRLDPALAETPEAQALWAEHRRRMAASLNELRPPLPEAGWSRIDPWALRAALGLVLVVALASAGWRIPHRLADAFHPGFAVAEVPVPGIEGWITPPAYTQAPPIFLTKDGVPVQGAEGLLAPPPWPDPAAADGAPRPPAAARAIEVPEGSRLALRVVNAPGPLELAVGGQTEPFEQVDAANQQIEARIAEGDEIAVRSGDDILARWRIAVRPDAPPRIAFAEPPAASARHALQLHYAASDDYGLARVIARIEPTDEPGQAMDLELQLPGLRPTEAKELSFHDLTAHPWAGREVTLTLIAEDEAEQVGTSPGIVMLLPERDFTHPVARALVEQRRELARAEPEIDHVELALRSISTVPQAFQHDTVVSLVLGVAAAKLRRNPAPEVLAEVQELLWDTALRLEDGDLSDAERMLRSAQRRLMEALARNAPDSEIQQLMRELREAMDRFLQAMAEQALRDMDELSEIPPEALEGRMLGEEQLRRMLDRAEEMARGGARDAAREMLSQLNRMLESLKQGKVMADPRSGLPGQQTMQDLSEILRDQQRLLDRSFREGQRAPRGRGRPGEEGQGQMPGQPGQQGQVPGQGQQGEQGEGRMGGLSGDAAEQEALRRRLAELLDRLGRGGAAEIPEALGRAGESMSDARDALQSGRPGAAAEAQSNALDQLRQGMRGLMNQLTDQLSPGGEGEGDMLGESGGNSEDPLGRPLPGDWEDGSSTKVPDQADLQRAREILEELYRRSGERFRPSLELDYIQRLLERF